MIRIVGILCGSAVAISFLIVALGMPEFLPRSEDFLEPMVATDTVANEASPNFAETDSQAAADPVDTTPEPDVATAAEIQYENHPEAGPFTESASLSATENWYAFWSPFRSEVAANGFVSQLQRTTGLDYRVVRLEPGVYEVAFLYSGDADINVKLAAISAATGLEMPGG
jgi:hypothetical protein